MLAADDMGMTNPKEYVYLSTWHNEQLDIEHIWQTKRSRADEAKAFRAFRPVLRVR